MHPRPQLCGLCNSVSNVLKSSCSPLRVTNAQFDTICTESAGLADPTGSKVRPASCRRVMRLQPHTLSRILAARHRAQATCRPGAHEEHTNVCLANAGVLRTTASARTSSSCSRFHCQRRGLRQCVCNTARCTVSLSSCDAAPAAAPQSRLPLLFPEMCCQRAAAGARAVLLHAGVPH